MNTVNIRVPNGAGEVRDRFAGLEGALSKAPDTTNRPLLSASAMALLEPPPAASVGSAEAAAAARQPESGGLYCAGEVRILVLDDDEQVCRVMQAALAPQGFTVDVISDPAAMIPALESTSYHIIILDYVIPGLEAEHLLEWIRAHQTEASIIVVTGYPSIEGALNCLRARTYDYITKPFQIAQLQKSVMRCLEGRGLLRMSESALRESLGSIIRDRRKALGLTLALMAQRTGVSLGYLSQIELGKNSASIETLYRISLGLGIRMGDLFQSIQPPG
jgi:CheY-like chemotaxis protein